MLHGWAKKIGLRLPPLLSWALTLLCVVLAWVPFRASGFAPAIDFYRGLFGFNGLAIPALYIKMLPFLKHFGHAVPVLPYLGAARTLSLPQAVLFLSFGWSVALLLPELHSMSKMRRNVALVASFALSLQALFFAPYTVPFLYYQF